MPDDLRVLARAPDPELVDIATAGLRGAPKTLPAKLFYDEEGCRLFYRITELPEYYLTRTERALLGDVAPQVVSTLRQDSVLVEYGASDEAKACVLLRASEAMPEPVIGDYVAIDVAGQALQEMRQRLRRTHPSLRVHIVTADFQQPIILPEQLAGRPPLGFFPGSTIGNLAPDAATRFLGMARRTLGNEAKFLIGADLRKDPARLIPAYDDASGVTAAFNRNLLARLNREAGADFDVQSFDHRAQWNDEESRIEMHLVSRRDQNVRIDNREIHFARGETIHTENSYKYTPERFIALARDAGWALEDMWTDAERLFALYLLAPVRNAVSASNFRTGRT